MTFKLVIIVAVALSLCACAARPPPQVDSKARVLKWFAANATAVQTEADRHCKQYGKLARVTQLRTDAGGRVLFECA